LDKKSPQKRSHKELDSFIVSGDRRTREARNSERKVETRGRKRSKEEPSPDNNQAYLDNPSRNILAAVTLAINNACNNPEDKVNEYFKDSIVKTIEDWNAITDARSIARRHNSSILGIGEKIIPLPTLHGVLPKFPLTIDEFWNLIESSVDSLLDAYGLPKSDSLEQKRSDLAIYCSIKPLF
jgi:hypothetical protein